MVVKDTSNSVEEILTSEEKEEGIEEQIVGELEALRANYTRLAADFDNFRKRSQRQSQELIARANEKLVCQLLPVLDNFCIALSSLTELPVLKGMTMIYDQLMAVLDTHGVKIIETEGCDFDPLVHEAVAHSQCADQADNAIVEELRKGYTLEGKVLRPAAVKVNIKKEDQE